MHIGVDIDGPIFDFVDSARLAYMDRYGVNPVGSETAYDWPTTEWGMNEKDLPQLFLDVIPWQNIRGPEDRVIETLMALNELGHYISIVTSRSLSLAEATLDQLRKAQIPLNSLVFTQDKGLCGLDLLIDDNPKHIEQIIASDKVGVIYPTSYNQACVKMANNVSLFTGTIKDLLWIVNSVSMWQ